MAKAPTKLTIFAYQVGFGDCFLLRFTYPKEMRHILIDFGTTGLSVDAENDQMLKIAKDIAERCGQQLDAVVATHRHADHISGFATRADGAGSGDIIRQLKPKVVIQPWTEQLDLARDATAPTGHAGFTAALSTMHAVAESVVSFLNNRAQGLDDKLVDQLRFIGEDNLSNKSAVKNLATMGDKQRYIFHGSPSGLENLLPGVTTHVLGPLTLEQTDTIRKQRSRDPNEFWQLQLRGLQADAAADVKSKLAPAFPEHVQAKGGKLPLNARWLANRIRKARGEQFLGLVRALDKQMNNTSVILLFETARKKILFPGDAQIENWRYALGQQAIRTMLEDVDVYKVGHHGSLNATPRSMWDKFSKKGSAKDKNRMTSVLSTRTGKHGSEKSNTEVPRSTLLKELAAQTHLHSTHTLPSGSLCEEIVIPL